MDDEVAGFRDVVEEQLERDGDGTFGVEFFDRTDDAIEFTLENSSRIFLFIQDSSRYSDVLKSWASLRPTEEPVLPKTSAGAFYTYVIDAFAPESGAVFCGNGYVPEEEQFISRWSQKDERIWLANKLRLAFGYPTDIKDTRGTIASVATRQFDRWTEARRSTGRSEESRVLDGLLEEMTVLCSLNQSKLHKLSPRQFEELIAYLFKNHGFEVELTAQTRDGGYDIILTNHPSLSSGPILVECKQFAPGRPVGVGIVRALYGVKTLKGASRSILATSSYVSTYAKREFSRVVPWEIEFLEGSRIREMCELYVPDILERRLDR
jgi:hypothetical protein